MYLSGASDSSGIRNGRDNFKMYFSEYNFNLVGLDVDFFFFTENLKTKM